MKKNKTSIDTVITDVDQQGPALKEFVKKHRSYLSPLDNSKYEKEAQKHLKKMYDKHNAQSEREKINVIESLKLKTPFELHYATDLMAKESNIGIEIYEVTYIQQKAKELASKNKSYFRK